MKLISICHTWCKLRVICTEHSYVHWQDNSHGNGRKLTATMYLDTWYPGDGGEIQLHAKGSEPVVWDPLGNRVVLFWSDKVQHQVMSVSSICMGVDCLCATDAPHYMQLKGAAVQAAAAVCDVMVCCSARWLPWPINCWVLDEVL